MHEWTDCGFACASADGQAKLMRAQEAPRRLFEAIGRFVQDLWDGASVDLDPARSTESRLQGIIRMGHSVSGEFLVEIGRAHV